MNFREWLRSLRSRIESPASRRVGRAQLRKRPSTRLWLEALEDRTVMSPLLTVTNLAVSGSGGAVVANSGTYSDTTSGAAVTLTASTGTVTTNSDGTWNWSAATPAGAAQTSNVTITASDSQAKTATEFWLNVGHVYTVTNTGDNGGVDPAAGAGTGTLRQAIIDANSAPVAGESNLIAFAIPTSDAGYQSATDSFRIQPLAPLPGVRSAIIDGYSQAGAQLNTLQGVGTLGQAPGDPSQYGDNAVLKIQLDGGQSPSFAQPGTAGLVMDAGIIQGLVIDGFTSIGIRTYDGATARGNFIGTDVTGSSAYDTAGDFLGNGRGVWVDGGGSVPVTIGGTAPGDRNVISGNITPTYEADEGQIFLDSYSDVLIQGNFIGTDRTGTKTFDAQGRSLGGSSGVSGFVNATKTALIGGTQAGAGNLISGNQVGFHSQSSGWILQGNFLGTDVTGMHATEADGKSLANTDENRADYSIEVGGADAGAGNLIAGSVNGLVLGSGNRVQGNYIGTNVLGDSTDAAFGPSQNSILSLGGNNLISGNLIRNQVALRADPNGAPGNGDNNTIEGNVIRYGDIAVGTSHNVIANNVVTSYTTGYGFGVLIDTGNDNMISSNVISHNGVGVSIQGGSGNTITRNTISDSQGGGIQLVNGGNHDQPAPVLTSVVSSSTSTTITGTLASPTSATVHLEFFANASPDAGGFYEGEKYLGSADVVVDASGNFTATIAAPLPVGQRHITATATDPTGNTSAFSAAFFVLLSTPTVVVTDAGGAYNGQPFAATATVAGLDGVAGTTLEGVGLTLDYQQLDANGIVVADLGAAAPSAAGTYQVTASFAGSTDYTAATSPSVAFTIAKATPTFGAVNTTVITDGTPTVTLTGTISDGALIPTGGVTVTVDGVSQAVAIGANGNFSAAFATGSLSVGTHSVTFTYGGDQNFNPAQANGSLDDTYSVLALFDQTHAKHAGSTLPVKIQLATVSGQDVSAGNLTVTALGIAPTTDTTDAVGSALPADVGALIPVQAAGGANPGNVFRCQGGANPFYMYNLQIPDGLAAGTYRLYFSVLGDPLVHWVTFTVG